MSFANVGKRWSTVSFPLYLKTLTRPSWAKSVTIHYTAAPSLAQRPHGFTAQHIENIRDYYRKTLGWSRGPHLFTDEDDIFGMTPLTMPGTHAVSFNSSSLSIEGLGNYDTEDPKSGRGLAVMLTTASTTRALLDWLGLKASRETVLFHRFDPRTTKTCPGTKVLHDWFLSLVVEAKPGELLATAEPDTGGPDSVETVPLVDYVAQRTGRSIAELAKLLRGEGSQFYLGEQWIEGARYDAAAQTTLAPQSEADEAVAALQAISTDMTSDTVPVVATMATRLGISYSAAAKRLSVRDGVFRWGTAIIDGARYDKATQTTVAPSRVLAKLPA
ncbi:MAG TPA: peptidoglycan recognition family protein [Bacteroidia bacterium]|nr:peptidoglycan recognition family protein [Bacteroidia bacterium]